MTSIPGRLGECLAATALVAAVALGNAASAEGKPTPTAPKFNSDTFWSCFGSKYNPPKSTVQEGYAAIVDCCYTAGGNPTTTGSGGSFTSASCPAATADGRVLPAELVQQQGPPPVLGPSAPTKPAPPVGQAPAAPSRQ